MNPYVLLRDSFRITYRTGALWALAFLLYLVMIPALVLAGGLGAVTSYLMLPGRENLLIGFQFPFQNLSMLEWVLFFAVSLFLLVVSSFLAWGVQAAMIRGADAAADGKPVSVKDSLRLGRQRWGSLLKLAFTFGLVIQALGILPALLALILRENTVWGTAVVPLLQTILSPFNTILGILVFLLMMSVALEDVRPKMAFRRIWGLVRSGWWGFLIAYILQVFLALAMAFVSAFILAVVVFLLLLAWSSQSAVEAVMAGAICVLSSPVGLALLTFVLVFSTVYFTLTYRAAADAAAGKNRTPEAEKPYTE
jgi:hypothetical protein